jgi:hypothetical protein
MQNLLILFYQETSHDTTYQLTRHETGGKKKQIFAYCLAYKYNPLFNFIV